MNRVILVAHGHLGQAMKASAEMIYGAIPYLETISFEKEEGLESLEAKLKTAIGQNAKPVLIMADLFCGTPYNASCSLAMKETQRKIEIVSGMSLPLVLEVATMAENTELSEIVNHLREVAQDTVQVFSSKELEDEEDF